MASKITEDELLEHFDEGTGLVAYQCGDARDVGFDPRHEPESGRCSHVNVYTSLGSSKRKTAARKLLARSEIRRVPNVEQLAAAESRRASG